MRIRKITEVMGMKVYTDSGDFFGEIEEANLSENKVDSWRIKVGGNMASMIGGARGVIIPQGFVKAVGDVFIINKSTFPGQEGTTEVPGDLM